MSKEILKDSKEIAFNPFFLFVRLWYNFLKLENVFSIWKHLVTIPRFMIIGIVVLLPYAFTDTYCCTVPYH